MERKDRTIEFATLCGPIFAVQAQKWIESVREYKQIKMWVFSTLMATRGARLSLDHVRALNMIEMGFYGRHIFGMRRQTKSERAVCNAWYAYLDDLSLEASQVDFQRRLNLFVGLLFAVSADVGFDFDRNQITKSIYSPIGHANIEDEQNQLRKAMLDVVTGRAPIKMEDEKFPYDPATVAAQTDLQQKFANAMQDGALSVEIKERRT